MSTTRNSIRSILPVLFLFLLIFAAEPIAAQSPAPSFYYYKGNRVSLQLDPSHIAVRFKSGVSLAARRSVTAQGGDLDSLGLETDTGRLDVSFIPVRAGHSAQAAIARLKSRPEVQSAGPIYQFPDGGRYGETDEFIVKFKSSVSASRIDTFNRANGVDLLRPQPYSRDVLILGPQPGNPRSALALANAYAESGLVEFAEPNFIIREPRPQSTTAALPKSLAAFPDDTYWPYQWALYNQQPWQGMLPDIDIHALNAWPAIYALPPSAQVTVTIAIIDVGVYPHPDLTSKLVTGINVTVEPNSSDTTPNENNFHGTAAAGIAAAGVNNGRGIAGTCPTCKIMPIKIAYENPDGGWFTYTSWIADGINWAYQNGADVLSNSWTMSGPSDDVTAAIQNAFVEGREWLGATIVSAAGNQDAYGVSFPANLGNYVLGVGATNWCDQRKTMTNDQQGCNNHDVGWGSNYGPGLDVVAPGEWLLTTCNGSRCGQGGAPANYTYMSGTSSATPLVAGVAGIIYSLKPSLTAPQLLQVLQNGAKSLPATPPDPGSGYKRVDAGGAVAGLYDLALSIKGGPGLAQAGDVVTYTIRYTNTGLTTVYTPTLKVTLPATLDYVSSYPSSTLQNDSYYLTLPSLARGAVRMARFTVRVQAGTEGQAMISTVQLSSPFPESVTSNNTVTDRIAVEKYRRFLPMLSQ